MVQLKIVSVGDFLVKAIGKITVNLFNSRFGPGNACIRALDYMLSMDVQFPENYIWTAEKTELLDASRYRRNKRKISQDAGRVLILYFVAKAVVKVFCHPVEHQIVTKKNKLLEMNMVAVLKVFFQAVQLACDHSVEENSKEFLDSLPVGDFESTYVSPQLNDAIQKWAKRLKEWSIRIYKDLDKGA
ncbi:hypothetical protein HDU98_011024 [Podochytrium sp. JEL0797]|nr:hypothetical protein HDU98_011024 [Podochytrium sp. JEL0797]